MWMDMTRMSACLAFILTRFEKAYKRALGVLLLGHSLFYTVIITNEPLGVIRKRQKHMQHILSHTSNTTSPSLVRHSLSLQDGFYYDPSEHSPFDEWFYCSERLNVYYRFPAFWTYDVFWKSGFVRAI